MVQRKVVEMLFKSFFTVPSSLLLTMMSDTLTRHNDVFKVKVLIMPSDWITMIDAWIISVFCIVETNCSFQINVVDPKYKASPHAATQTSFKAVTERQIEEIKTFCFTRFMT